MNDFEKRFSKVVEKNFKENKKDILKSVQRVIEKLTPTLSTPNFGVTN